MSTEKQFIPLNIAILVVSLLHVEWYVCYDTNVIASDREGIG